MASANESQCKRFSNSRQESQEERVEAAKIYREGLGQWEKQKYNEILRLIRGKDLCELLFLMCYKVWLLTTRSFVAG